jgi:hypothetical protein
MDLGDMDASAWMGNGPSQLLWIGKSARVMKGNKTLTYCRHNLYLDAYPSSQLIHKHGYYPAMAYFHLGDLQTSTFSTDPQSENFKNRPPLVLRFRNCLVLSHVLCLFIVPLLPGKRVPIDDCHDLPSFIQFWGLNQQPIQPTGAVGNPLSQHGVISVITWVV